MDQKYIFDDLRDYEKIKKMLHIRMYDMEENRDFLKGKVYTPYGVLAAAYRIYVIGASNGRGSVPVTEELVKYWGLDTQQIHKDTVAVENKRNQAKLYYLTDMIKGLCNDTEAKDLLNDDSINSDSQNSGVFVLTSTAKVNGASVIARDGLLDHVSGLLGGSFYILPSSIHEVILVPDDGMHSWEDLTNMVKQVNEACVKPEDKLSDKVMRYDHRERTLQQIPRQGLKDRLAETQDKAKQTGQKKKESYKGERMSR